MFLSKNLRKKLINARAFSTKPSNPATPKADGQTRQFSSYQTEPYAKQHEPQFWSGAFPSTVDENDFKFDCNGKLPAADKEFQKAVHEVFEKKGLVWVTNTGATQLKQLADLVDLAIEDKTDYKGGANDRGVVDEDAHFYEAGTPPVADIHYHHEMSYMSRSTTRLVFSICDFPSDGRGGSWLSEQVGVTDEILQTDLGQKLKDKRVCYHRYLTDREAYVGQDDKITFNHWQKSYMTDDPEEAQHLAEKTGLEVTWEKDWQGNPRYMKTKFYVDAYEYAPMLDRNVLYASPGDSNIWFDSWPGIANLKPEDRYLQLTYGDDTEITQKEFKQWLDLNDKYGFPVRFMKGDFVMFCNYRFAHGRPGFQLYEGEKRDLGVVLGSQFTRVGQRPDKW